jgi:outer membrane receptor protein involved in Fe transport
VSFGSCAATPPTVIVDQRLRNIANLRVKGIDASIDWPFATALGEWKVGLNSTYVLAHEQKLSPTAPSLDLLNVSFNPIDLRLRADVVWTLGSLSADLAANYVDGYRETAAPTSRRIDSWTTIDAGIAYTFGSRTGLTDEVTIAARAVNLLDEDPPFVDLPLGFDSANATPLGRLLSLQISKKW